MWLESWWRCLGHQSESGPNGSASQSTVPLWGLRVLGGCRQGLTARPKLTGDALEDNCGLLSRLSLGVTTSALLKKHIFLANSISRLSEGNWWFLNSAKKKTTKKKKGLPGYTAHAGLISQGRMKWEVLGGPLHSAELGKINSKQAAAVMRRLLLRWSLIGWDTEVITATKSLVIRSN